MKKSLAHLPQDKQGEVELVGMKIRSLCEDVHKVILFGSYARGDWKDGPHEQGRGRLIIHKRSDYDILGDLADDYYPELAGILPRETESQKELFELLDYAYIGARYDLHYKITKKQLEQLAPCVKKLHEVTEKICAAKINSFI